MWIWEKMWKSDVAVICIGGFVCMNVQVTNYKCNSASSVNLEENSGFGLGGW